MSFTKTINVPSPCPSGGGDHGGGGGFNFCAGLLLAAIGLMIVGSLLIVAGVCSGIAGLSIAGAIVAGIGLLLFILWIVFCLLFTPCSVIIHGLTQAHFTVTWTHPSPVG
jgi:hypothetical protein